VSVHIGDRLLIESERAGQAGRSCVVEEVLSEQPQRLRVRWDDGRESIFVPAAGVARIAEAAPATTKPKPRRKTTKTKT
jgi:Domain of unknown function (DUF1918)